MHDEPGWAHSTLSPLLSPRILTLLLWNITTQLKLNIVNETLPLPAPPTSHFFLNNLEGLIPLPSLYKMVQQKIVLKLLAMNDEKTKQKAIEAVAEIYGIDSIAANSNEQKMTIIGEMDTVAIAKKLKKIGKIDIISVGPDKEEKK